MGAEKQRGKCMDTKTLWHIITQISMQIQHPGFLYSCQLWVMGEAWLATHIWEHFEYTGDKKFLEEHFEILQACVEFFTDFMIRADDLTLVTSPSVSPENTYIMKDGRQGCMCEGAVMDVEILMELLEGYKKA